MGEINVVLTLEKFSVLRLVELVFVKFETLLV